MPNRIKAYLAESGDDAAFNVLLALSTALFMLQLLSLYTTPIPDSYLWWGDESWLMLEFRTQILEGVFRHPYALGSSLEHGSGLIFGNMWIPALLYGIPAALFNSGMDIILIGRTVTALLSASLLFALFEIIRRLTNDRIIALFGVTLLLSSRSFLLTSHSARYDILTSLAILVGLFWLLRLSKKSLVNQAATRPLISPFAFLSGVIVTSSLLITIHVTLALWIATLLCVAVSGRTRVLVSVSSFLAGSCFVVFLLVGVSTLRSPFTLLGGSGTAFYLNLRDIPALRLFSRSVQSANLVQKWNTLSSLGLEYFVAIGAVAILAVDRIVRKDMRLRFDMRPVVICLILFSWIEFESAAPTSYLIYMLPVLSVAVALAAWRTLPITGRSWIILGAGIVLSVYGLSDAWKVRSIGRDISKANDRAVNDALGQIIHGSAEGRPLVLASNPAIHCVLLDTSVRLMTTHLVEFPSSTQTSGGLSSVEYAIRKARVRYILLYRSGIRPEYMREIGPISDAARSLGVLVWQQAGIFTDIGRSYFDGHAGLPDTLQLYHLYD